MIVPIYPYTIPLDIWSQSIISGNFKAIITKKEVEKI